MNGNLKRAFCGLLLLCLTNFSAAQEVSVPLGIQYQLFWRVLTFDRNFRNKPHKGIVIGIAYQRSFPPSRDIKDELLKVIRESATQDYEGLPIRAVTIGLEREKDLERTLAEADIDILYLTPLRLLDIGALAKICQLKNVMTLTGVPDYVKLGITLGFRAKEDKTQILINLRSAKLGGSDFSSGLFNLTRIVIY